MHSIPEKSCRIFNKIFESLGYPQSLAQTHWRSFATSANFYLEHNRSNRGLIN